MKVKVTKIVEVDRDFEPDVPDCSTHCPFRLWEYSDGHFKSGWTCGLGWSCPFTKEDGWECEVIGNP